MIKILNESDFQQYVIDAEGKVLVEFFATWCPHCQRMMPVIEDVAEKLEGEVPVYQVDVDKSPTLAAEYTEGFPAFLLFENGEVVNEVLGECPESEIMALVEG